MQFTEQEMKRRMEQFPDAVRLLAYRDERIQAVFNEYIKGEILTEREALCRIIMELATELDVRDRIAAEYSINATPFDVKPDLNISAPKYVFLTEGYDPAACDKLNKGQ